jgi:hypothetical protein
MSWFNNNNSENNVNNFANTQQSLPTDYNKDYNSKIYFPKNENAPSYNLFQGQKTQQNCYDQSLQGIMELNNVSKTFFNKENVDVIQNRIIEEVFKQEKQKIGKQSQLQLQIIMRSVYLSFGKNINKNIQSQVLSLNDIVIKESLKEIIPNLKQYLMYREDISKPRYIPPHSINASKGNNSISLVNW